MSAPEQKSANPGWGAVLTHPVTVGVAIWLFIPVGIVLLLMNPTLRKDRRWWAGAAAWGVYLLWVGRLPLISSQSDSATQGSSTLTHGAVTKHREETTDAVAAGSSARVLTNNYYTDGYAYGLELAEACKRIARGSPSTAGEQAAKWQSELTHTLRQAHPRQTDLISLTQGKLNGLTDGLSGTALLPQ